MDVSNPQWRKPSRSALEGNCVEIAFVVNRIFARDSKNPAGHILACNQTEWTAFLGVAKNGNLDLR